MKKISYKEKNRILELHYKTLIKPYLFENNEPIIIQGKGGDPWEYKKENGKYYTKKKTDTNWVDVSNQPNAKYNIAKFIFNDDVPKPASTLNNTNVVSTNTNRDAQISDIYKNTTGAVEEKYRLKKNQLILQYIFQFYPHLNLKYQLMGDPNRLTSQKQEDIYKEIVTLKSIYGQEVPGVTVKFGDAFEKWFKNYDVLTNFKFSKNYNLEMQTALVARNREISKLTGMSFPNVEQKPQPVMRGLTDYEAKEAERTAIPKWQLEKIIQRQKELDRADPTKWEHEQLQALALASLFIPFVGPLLSIQIELWDIEKYIKEKDYYSAGLFSTFLLLPFMKIVPNSIKKIIAKYTTDQIGNLIKRIFGRGKLTPDEVILRDYVLDNSGKLVDEMDNLVKSNADVLANKSLKYVDDRLQQRIGEKLFNYGLKGLKWGAPLVIVPVSYHYAWETFTETIDEKANKLDIDLEILREQFNSSGSEEDEKKLSDFLSNKNNTNCGTWVPNSLIPLVYQTNLYRAELKYKLPILIKYWDKIVSAGETDCRIPGTIGSLLPHKIGNNSYYYKFANGVYSKMLRGTDIIWVEVKDEKEKEEIHKIFTSYGLVKDNDNIAYLK
jgi:hypothetical protein